MNIIKTLKKIDSNKKRKKTNPINWKKIGIFGGVVAFLILLVIIIGVATKDKFYECVQYDWYEKVNTQEIKTQDGMKEDYEFYRLFLESDGTFELKYRLKNGTITYTDQGTYKKTKTTLILTYSSPSQELVKVCREGNFTNFRRLDIHGQQGDVHPALVTAAVVHAEGDQQGDEQNQQEYKDLYNEAEKIRTSGEMPKELKMRIDAARSKHKANLKSGKVSDRWTTLNELAIIARWLYPGLH